MDIGQFHKAVSHIYLRKRADQILALLCRTATPSVQATFELHS